MWSYVDEYPEHVPALTFALNTGARKGEQFRLTWPESDISRKQVVLPNTKIGRTRYVQLNKTCLEALGTISTLEEAPQRIRFDAVRRTYQKSKEVV